MRNLPILFSLFLLASTTACIPEPTAYPYRPADEIVAEAEQLSADLEDYIIGWLDGENLAQIPAELIPDGIVDAHSFELMHPDSATFEDTWAWRFAQPINTDSLYNSLPDPNVTYLLLGPALVPYGSKVHLEGEFPRCRFFSFQMSQSLSGEEYIYDRAFGGAETSIADVDIEPLPGHTNPFRLGADRTAADRSYHVTFNLQTGNSVALSNGNFAAPYRYPGNERFGGLIQYQGPWGLTGGFNGITPGTGEWNMGGLWVRIYAPDGTDPLGGVAMPKVSYELPDGRRYFITANFDNLIEKAGATVPAQESYTAPNANISPDLGWQKSYGILLNILSGVAQANNWVHPDSLAKIRAVDLGVTGRAADAPAPRNYEAHATINNYTSYLGKYVRLDTGQVAIFTGKLPTFPDTRHDGITTMMDAQCRYWSLIGYDNDPFFAAPGSAVCGILDDEVILDEDRNYIIVLSREEDRPAGATAENGVSWVDWGPTMDLGFILRTVTLGNDWNFDQSPTAPSLPWSTGDLTSPSYDSTLIGQNWHRGYMGCYLPQLTILSTEAFDALPANLSVTDVPIQISDRYELGLSSSANATITASATDAMSSATFANDYDLSSLWLSPLLEQQTQQEWVTIDLGGEQIISGVKIIWPLLLHATDYQLLVSNDNENWTPFYSNNAGDGLVDVVQHLQGVQGRYVRLAMNSAVLFNYGLHNFEVYSPATDCLAESPVATTTVVAPTETLHIYPNPTSGPLRLDCNADQWPATISVFNVNGQLLQTTNYHPNFNLTHPSGVYYLVVTGNGQRYVNRVVKL
ncbi:MAG: discoidin domain-containing protein [Bacteroidota bacterium]